MSENIPYGYCQCGCGQLAPIAEQSATKYRYVRGEPKRFILGHSLRVRKLPSSTEKFWMHTTKGDPDQCWEWQGPKNGYGYGMVQCDKKKRLRAHRVSYEIHYGEIPPGMLVCHRCDNPSCVNPDHLFLGSIADNMHDKTSKGRQNRGETSPVSKLTNADVIAIRKMASEGRMLKDIAVVFGVEKSTVSGIVSRKHWKHI